tara:strand:+ start:703 stop:1455 length:753 start_codon:yes stop_codon:yes gene_type:complete
MAEEEELTHAQKVDRHFREILGRPNPFAFAHSGTPEQRKGGLGSNKGAARYQNTSAEDRAKANSDGRFGYFDEVNKRYVPAIFDMMDGGGRDTRGDTFKGGIFSGMLNDMGVKPYGSQMERAMVSPDTSPIVQAVNAVPQGITDAQRTSAAMAEEARQRGLRQDVMDDPRLGMTQNSPITMGIDNNQAYAMRRDQLAQAAQAEQVRMAAIIDEARGLAARSGLNFDMMPQQDQEKFINAVRSGVGGSPYG